MDLQPAAGNHSIPGTACGVLSKLRAAFFATYAGEAYSAKPAQVYVTLARSVAIISELIADFRCTRDLNKQCGIYNAQKRVS